MANCQSLINNHSIINLIFICRHYCANIKEDGYAQGDYNNDTIIDISKLMLSKSFASDSVIIGQLDGVVNCSRVE